MIYTGRNRNIDIYLNEIRSNSSMTVEDEQRLFVRISKGDKSAETEIFKKMSKLAIAIAKTYTGDAELLEDCIQEANLGILDAIHRFDINRKLRFSSFARWWMKAYISKSLNELDTVYSTGNRLTSKVRKISEEYYRQNGEDISVYELMDKLEEMGEIVTNPTILTEIKITSIDQQIDDDFEVKDSELFNEVTASRNMAEDNMDNEQMRYDVRQMMKCLTERECELVKMYFGIDYENPMNYDMIADKCSLGTERVRQIITGAIKKMKQ